MVTAAEKRWSCVLPLDESDRSCLQQLARQLQRHQPAIRQDLIARWKTGASELSARDVRLLVDFGDQLLEAFLRRVSEGDVDGFLDRVRALAGEAAARGAPLDVLAGWFALFQASSRPFLKREMPDPHAHARLVVRLSEFLQVASLAFVQTSVDERVQRLEAQYHSLRAHHRVLALLIEESNVSAMCARLAREFQQLTSCDRVCIALLDDSGQYVEEYTAGTVEWYASQHGSSEFLDTTTSPAGDERATPSNDSIFSIPLALGSEKLGVLTLASRHSTGCSPDDVELAHFVARHLASAIARTRRSAETRLRAGQWEALRHIIRMAASGEPAERVIRKMIGALVNMLDADAGGLFFLDERLVAQFGPVGYGLNDRHLRELQRILAALTSDLSSTKMPIAVSNVSRDARFPADYAHRFGAGAALIVPLIVQGVPVGVIVLHYAAADRIFEPIDLHLAGQVAQLLALVADHQRLASVVPGHVARWAALLDAVHEAIYVVDPASGHILDANARAEEMTGYGREELRKKTILDLFPEENQSAALVQLRAAITQAAAVDIPDLYQWRKDGSQFHAHCRVRGVVWDDQRQVFVLVRDLSHLEEAQRYVIQAERQEALEQLGLTMRHEINNPLTGILGNVQLLLLKEDLPDDVRQRLETVESLTLRIRDIMRRLETIKDQTIEYLGQRKMIDLRAGATEKPERQRVLVVDDETSIVTLLTTVLSKEGFAVEGVHDGRSALQRIESESFDHILLDIKMPDLDGKQIYQLVKNRNPQMAERIVFITGDASSPETFDFILETGNKYLKKPFTLQEIKAVLVPFLRNYAPA